MAGAEVHNRIVMWVSTCICFLEVDYILDTVFEKQKLVYYLQAFLK